MNNSAIWLLGLLLFINDATTAIPRRTRLFYVDRAKIYDVISWIDDCRYQQGPLNLFKSWARETVSCWALIMSNNIIHPEEATDLLSIFAVWTSTWANASHTLPGSYSWCPVNFRLPLQRNQFKGEQTIVLYSESDCWFQGPDLPKITVRCPTSLNTRICDCGVDPVSLYWKHAKEVCSSSFEKPSLDRSCKPCLSGSLPIVGNRHTGNSTQCFACSWRTILILHH